MDQSIHRETRTSKLYLRYTIEFTCALENRGTKICNIPVACYATHNYTFYLLYTFFAKT